MANPLALVAQQQSVYHPPQHHPTQFTNNSLTRSQQAATRNRGKAIVNSSQPIYGQEPLMVDEDDETSKDKEIDKLMALISLSFKKIYKPTNNNLRTSSNIRRANQDNSPRINKNAGYENQQIGNVVRARETVGSIVVQKSGIQCYNCKEFGHVARECQKPKRAKDAAYHKEKMLLYKQEEAGIQLNAEQADWKDDTDDDELEDQELEAHYMYMGQLQQVSPDAADSGPNFDDEPLQKAMKSVLKHAPLKPSILPKLSRTIPTFNIQTNFSIYPVDGLVPSSSSKIDSLFDEFAGELALLKSIPPGIDETNCHHVNETQFAKRLLYDNSSPRLPEEFISENSNADVESFSPSHIHVEDSDSLMEEIDLSFTTNDPMPRALRKMTMTLKGIFQSVKNCLIIIPFHSLRMSHFILIFLHPLVLLQNHQMVI
nr:hypothetical protein [Tanacetum cinerariifolium]